MLKNLFIQMTLKGWRRIDLAEKADVPSWQVVRCIKHPKLYRFKHEEKLRIAKTLGIERDRIDWLFADIDERFEDVKDIETKATIPCCPHAKHS